MSRVVLSSLTPEQEARLPVIRDKWIAIGLSTEPADRVRAEAGIRLAYQRAGLKEPDKTMWLGSPMAGALCCAYIRALQNATPKVMASVGASVIDSVIDSVRDSVWASVWASVRDSVWASVMASVRDSVGDSVWDSVGASVWDSVRASVGASVIDSVIDSVGASVRASVIDSVIDSVGASVRDSVGDSVWDSVRDSVGDSVWDSVRASVGASVWDSVRASVGASVMDSVRGSGYGQHDANWIGFYETFREFGLHEQTEKIDGLRELTESCGWYWTLKGLCILTDRPCELHRDERGRLHAPDRAALEYRDGWGIYAWHGVRVSEQIIRHPELITAPQIRDEANAEIRRVMLERFGADRFIHDIGALPVHADETGTLYKVNLADDEPLVMVSLVNCTPEAAQAEGLIQAPDGSWRKRYWLRVPPTMHTAREAVAWTFRQAAGRYSPAIET